MAMHEHDPGVMMARSSLMSCTWTETMQMLEPIGIDRWPYDSVAQVRHARCAHLLGRAAVDGRLLVAEGAVRRAHAADAHHPVRGGELCGAAPGAVDPPRSALARQAGAHHRRASWRFCGWCRWDGGRTRSPRCSTSARRRCAATSRRCRASSACATVRKRRQRPSDSS